MSTVEDAADFASLYREVVSRGWHGSSPSAEELETWLADHPKTRKVLGRNADGSYRYAKEG